MDLSDEAEAYAAADFGEVNQAFVDRLVELAGERTGARALDLGCGPGDIAIRCARARPSWRIMALDASEAMIAIARRAIVAAGLGDRITAQLADAKATKLAAGSFDVIFSNSLLHHMPEPIPLWREIRRLAGPGALVFVRDLMRASSEAEARRLVEMHAGKESELLKEEFYRSILAAFTPDEVKGQLEAAGLKSLGVEPVTDRYLDVFGRI